MAYHVYTTKGIILSGKPQSDADKYYSIFTEELGLIIASAKSVRKVESKLRFGLDDFTISEISFIRGRYGWKITSSKDIENIYTSFRSDHGKRDSALRILLLLRQLVVGEEQNKELFMIVLSSLEFLQKSHLSVLELKAFECIAILRILTVLGYAQYNESYSSFVETSAWSSFIIADAQGHITDLIRDINHSIEASQL